MDSENKNYLKEYSIVDVQNILWGVGVKKKIELILHLINKENKETSWKKSCSIVLLSFGEFVNGFSLISNINKNDENEKVKIKKSLNSFLEKLRKKEKVLRSLEEWKKENLSSLSQKTKEILSPIIYSEERKKITLFRTEEELVSSFQTNYQSVLDGENILKQIEALKKSSPSSTQQKERKKYGIVNRIGFQDAKRRKKRNKKTKKVVFEDQQPSTNEEIKSLEKSCIQKFENVLKTNNFSILREKAYFHLCQFPDFLRFIRMGILEYHTHPFFINAFFRSHSKKESHQVAFYILSIFNHLYPSQEINQNLKNEQKKEDISVEDLTEELTEDEKPNQERVLRLYSEVNDFSKKLNQKHSQDLVDLNFINNNCRVRGSLFDSRFKNICDDKSFLENRLLQKYKIMKEYIIYDENSEEYEEEEEISDDEESEGEDYEDDESTFQFYDILKENDEEEVQKIPIPYYSKFSVQSKGDYLLIRNYPQNPNPISFLMYKGKIAVVFPSSVFDSDNFHLHNYQKEGNEKKFGEIEFYQFSKNYCQVLCSIEKNNGVVMMFLYKGSLVVPEFALHEVPRNIKVYREDFLVIQSRYFTREESFSFNDGKKKKKRLGVIESGYRIESYPNDFVSYRTRNNSFVSSNSWFFRDKEIHLDKKTIFMCKYFDGIRDVETIIDLISVQNNTQLKSSLETKKNDNDFDNNPTYSFSLKELSMMKRTTTPSKRNQKKKKRRRKNHYSFYRRNLTPFNQFCLPYQSFLITLHFLLRYKNSPFGKLSVDVLEHCILPFFAELEFFEMQNPEYDVLETIWYFSSVELLRGYFEKLLFKEEFVGEEVKISVWNSIDLKEELLHRSIIYFSLLKYSKLILNTKWVLRRGGIFPSEKKGISNRDIFFLSDERGVLFGKLMISVITKCLDFQPTSRRSLFLQKEVIEFLFSLRRKSIPEIDEQLIESLERIFFEMMEIYETSFVLINPTQVNAEKKYKDVASDDFRLVYPKLMNVRNCIGLILKIICASKFTPRIIKSLRLLCSKMTHSVHDHDDEIQPNIDHENQPNEDSNFHANWNNEGKDLLEFCLFGDFFETIISYLCNRRGELIENRDSLYNTPGEDFFGNCDLFEILNHPLVFLSSSVFENVIKILNQLLAWYPTIITKKYEYFNVSSSIDEIKESIFSNEEESDINHLKTLNSECVKRFSTEIPLPFLSGNIKWRKFIRNPPILLEMSTKSKWFDNVLTKILPYEKDPEEVFTISLKIFKIYEKSFQMASSNILDIFSNQDAGSYMNRIFCKGDEHEKNEEEEGEHGEEKEKIFIVDKRGRHECFFSSLSACINRIYDYLDLFISDDSKKEVKLIEINLDFCFLNSMLNMFLIQNVSSAAFKSFVASCIIEYQKFKKEKEEDKFIFKDKSWIRLWRSVFSKFLDDLLIVFIDSVDVNQLPFESTTEVSNYSPQEGHFISLKKYSFVHSILFYFVIPEYFMEEISGTSLWKHCCYSSPLSYSEELMLEIDSSLLLKILLSHTYESKYDDEECEGEIDVENDKKIGDRMRNYVRMNAMKITSIHLFHKLNIERRGRKSDLKRKIKKMEKKKQHEAFADTDSDEENYWMKDGLSESSSERLIENSIMKNIKKEMFRLVDSVMLLKNEKFEIEEKFVFLDFIVKIESFNLDLKEFNMGIWQFNESSSSKEFLLGLEPRKIDIITYLLGFGKHIISNYRYHNINDIQVISNFLFREVRKYLEGLKNIRSIQRYKHTEEKSDLRSMCQISDKHIQLVFEILGILNTFISSNPTISEKTRDFKLIINGLLVFFSRIFRVKRKNSGFEFLGNEEVLNNKMYIRSVFDVLYMLMRDYFDSFDCLSYECFFEILPYLLKKLLFVNFSNSLKIELDWKLLVKLLVHWGDSSSSRKSKVLESVFLNGKNENIDDIFSLDVNLEKDVNGKEDDDSTVVKSSRIVSYRGNFFWNHHLIIFLLKNIFNFFGPKGGDEEEDDFRRREGLKALADLTMCFSDFFKQYFDINYNITGIGQLVYEEGFKNFVKIKKEGNELSHGVDLPIEYYVKISEPGFVIDAGGEFSNSNKLRKPVKPYWKLSTFLKKVIVDTVNHCSTIEDFDQILSIDSFIDCGKRVNAGDIIIKKMKSFKKKSQLEERILSEFSEKKQIKIKTLKEKEEKNIWSRRKEFSFEMSFEGRIMKEEVPIKKKKKEEVASTTTLDDQIFDFKGIFGDKNNSFEEPKEIKQEGKKEIINNNVFSFDGYNNNNDSFNFTDDSIEKENVFLPVTNLEIFSPSEEKGKEFEDDLFSFSDNIEDSKETKKEDVKSQNGEVFNFEL